MSYKQLQPILVVNGGTSIQSATPYAPICGGATSSTDPFQSIASAGISGQILTSSGASLPAAFQAYGWDQTNTQVFSTNGSYTYTPTSGMVYVIVEAIGAGGGAGYASAGAGAWNVTAGGSAGGYTRGGFNAVTIGSSQSITIGLGGAGGIESTSTQAQTGGDTLFGSLLTGSGGNASNSGTGGGGAVVGGSASGGFLNLQGMAGFIGTSKTGAGNYAYGGQGAHSMYGSGGQEAFISATSSAANGNNGTGNGSGGGGCACSNSTANGGAGTDGIIIVTEFIL